MFKPRRSLRAPLVASLVLTVLAIFSTVLVIVHAADGDLDPTFTTTDRPGTVDPGVSRIFFPGNSANDAGSSDARFDTASFVGLQSDGRMIVVGQSFAQPATNNSPIALVRLNTDGTRDTTFGGAPGGKVAIGAPSPIAGPGHPFDHRNPRFSKAVMAGDKIVIVGNVE